MKHVSIQTKGELHNSLSIYRASLTDGREPDKDYIFKHNIKLLTDELARRNAESAEDAI